MEVAMSEPTRWHTVPNSTDLHKGPSAGCTRCARLRATRKRAAKEDGRAGGQLSAARQPSAKVVCCRKCNVPITPRSTTGLCRVCYNLRRALNKKPTRKRKSRYCINPACKQRISDDNKGGLCLKCYRNSEVWQQYKKNRASWAAALLLSSDT